jgi:recombinational DNA repair protein RecT
MSKEIIKSITDAINKLENSEVIKGILNGHTSAIVNNEVANVASILTTPTKTDSAKKMQALLIECTPQSWCLVVTQAIQLGITLNPLQKHCAVIPYGGKATMSIMVAGLRHLLYSNNIVKSMTANAVCENDHFKMAQPLLPETIAQNFKFEKAKTNRGNIIGCYAFFVLSNGQFIGDYLPIEEADKRKKAAMTDYIWKAWAEEMYEKTAVRYVQKQMPTMTNLDALINEIEQQHFDYEKVTQKPKELPKAELSELDANYNNVLIQYAQGNVSLAKIEERYKITNDIKEKLEDARATYSA